MKKRLSILTALAGIALLMSGCLVINVEKSGSKAPSSPSEETSPEGQPSSGTK